MTKPWLETWTASAGEIVMYKPDAGGEVGRSQARFRNEDNDREHAAARARLAAAAPALVRAIVAVEWVSMPDRPYRKCPACDADEPDRDHPWWTHAADCPVDAALTAAGLATQAEREEARKAIR